MRAVANEDSKVAGVLAFALDALLLALLIAVALLIVVGPGIYEPFGLRLKLRTANNPVTIALVLALLRVWMGPSIAFLGLAKLSAWLHAAHGAMLRVTANREGDSSVRRFVIGCVAIAVVARAFQAWQYPGFATGDDVEIHEMTLGALSGSNWPVWDIRSAFYPMTFIYPSQLFARAAGVEEVHVLVFAGRFVVVLVSAAAIWLTWVAARPMLGDGTAALAAALVGISKLHMAYGSSELPRPVAATLLIGAFTLVLRSSTAAVAIVAGGLIGVAAALRFSEAVFVVPGVLHLWLAGRRSQAALLAATAGMAATAITAIADLTYWGSAFQSLGHAWAYTLTERLSSRGFQPFHYYLTALQHWTNWILFAFACIGWREPAARPAAMWALLPIAILSALPHKEARYLIPVIPFVAIGAAAGIARVARWIVGAGSLQRRAAFGALIVAAGLYELGEWRLRRSNDAVALARYLRQRDPVAGVAVEQLWRAGGALYLSGRQTLVDIAAEDIASALRSSDISWLALQVDTVAGHGYEPALLAGGWVVHAPFGEYVLFEAARRGR